MQTLDDLDDDLDLIMPKDYKEQQEKDHPYHDYDGHDLEKDDPTQHLTPLDEDEAA